MTIAKKMQDFCERSSWIRKMFEEGIKLKKTYGSENIFDFSLGNPDLPPPEEFQKTMQRLVNQEVMGAHAYMPNAGFPAARDAVAGQLSIEQEVPVQGEDVILTCGAAGALNVIMKALLDPGDEVIILSPYFVEYSFYIDNHGGTTRVVPTSPVDFSLNLTAIEEAITSRTKAILINSPNNPTGQIYDAASLAGLGHIIYQAGRKHKKNIYLVADEPYRKIAFDGLKVPAVFPACYSSLVVSSFSKDLSIPGERIGYLAVHPEMPEKETVTNALILANRILGFVNAPAFMQRAIIHLQGIGIDAGRYQRRRDLFCRILSAAGYSFIPPKGAFYLFPRSPLANDVEFVMLLAEQRILAVPGKGFGAPGYFRLAFCVSEDIIERSADAFTTAIDKALNKNIQIKF